jgi:hypothetical protein
MWLPDWIYELLPYLYAVSGSATVVFFDKALSRISGVLLLLTAGIIWVTRRNYRQGMINNGNEMPQVIDICQ